VGAVGSLHASDSRVRCSSNDGDVLAVVFCIGVHVVCVHWAVLRGSCRMWSACLGWWFISRAVRNNQGKRRKLTEKSTLQLQSGFDDDMASLGDDTLAAADHERVYFRMTSDKQLGRFATAHMARGAMDKLGDKDLAVTLRRAFHIDPDLGRVCVDSEPLTDACNAMHPIAVLSDLFANVDVLQDQLLGWTTKDELHMRIPLASAGADHVPDLLSRMIEVGAFPGGGGGRLSLPGGEHDQVLATMTESGMVVREVSADGVPSCSLTPLGMQRIACAWRLDAPYKVLAPRGLAIQDAIVWELILQLEADVWEWHAIPSERRCCRRHGW